MLNVSFHHSQSSPPAESNRSPRLAFTVTDSSLLSTFSSTFWACTFFESLSNQYPRKLSRTTFLPRRLVKPLAALGEPSLQDYTLTSKLDDTRTTSNLTKSSWFSSSSHNLTSDLRVPRSQSQSLSQRPSSPYFATQDDVIDMAEILLQYKSNEINLHTVNYSLDPSPSSTLRITKEKHTNNFNSSNTVPSYESRKKRQIILFQQNRQSYSRSIRNLPSSHSHTHHLSVHTRTPLSPEVPHSHQDLIQSFILQFQRLIHATADNSQSDLHLLFPFDTALKNSLLQDSLLRDLMALFIDKRYKTVLSTYHSSHIGLLSLPHLNIALAACCCTHRGGDKAISIIHSSLQTITPDSTSFYLAITACVRSSSPFKALDLLHATRTSSHFSVQSMSKPVRLHLYNMVLDVFSRAALYESCSTLLHEMLIQDDISPDITSFNHYIAAALNANRLDVASTLFQNLSTLNLLPNLITYTSFMKYHHRLGDTNTVMEIFDSIIRNGLNPTDATYEIAISVSYRASQHGNINELFSQMKKARLTPTLPTYKVMMDSCQDRLDYNAALELLIHAQNQNRSLPKSLYDSCIEGALSVDYTISLKALDLQIARGMKPKRSTYDKLIIVCIKNNDIKKAIYLIQRKPSLGVLSNISAVNAFLLICAKRQNLSAALAIFDDCLNTNDTHIPNSFTFKILFDCCKDPKDYFRVINLLNIPMSANINTNIYAACMNALEKSGQNNSALHLLWLMQLNGFKPDSTFYSACIRLCKNWGDDDAIRGLLNDMKEDGIFVTDLNVIDSCLRVCGKCGYGQQALHIIEYSEANGVELTESQYSNAIKAAAKANNASIAVNILNRMRRNSKVEPNVYCFNSAIVALASQSKWEQALELLHDMALYEIQPNIVTYNACLKACAKAGNLEGAEKLLDEMRTKNVVPDSISFSSIMNACLPSLNFKKAIHYLNEMKRVGLKLDVVSYSSCINVCVRANATDAVASLMDEILSSKIKLDAVLYTLYLEFLSKQGRYQETLKTMKDMLAQSIQPNVYSFTCCITACAKACKADDALSLLRDMRRLGLHPTVIAYNATIYACARCGLYTDATQLLDEMRVFGLEPNVVSYNFAIRSCVKGSALTEAFNLFNEMKLYKLKPDLISYNYLLNCCCQSGNSDKSIDLLADMESMGVTPTKHSYDLAIRACATNGTSTQVITLLRRMVEKGFKASGTTKKLVLQAVERYNACRKEALSLLDDLS